MNIGELIARLDDQIDFLYRPRSSENQLIDNSAVAATMRDYWPQIRATLLAGEAMAINFQEAINVVRGNGLPTLADKIFLPVLETYRRTTSGEIENGYCDPAGETEKKI